MVFRPAARRLQTGTNRAANQWADHPQQLRCKLCERMRHRDTRGGGCVRVARVARVQSITRMFCSDRELREPS